MAKRKHGRAKNRRKNTKTLTTGAGREEQLKQAPHTFVFSRGQVGKSVKELVTDLRRVLEPFTASKLKVRKKNVLKDFVSVAGPLHVTHFLTFSRTKINTQLRVIRLPRGPTITFRLCQYSLSKDIVSSIKRPNMEHKQFQEHPLLIMNNFSREGMHFKLMSTMFQNMLPSINISKVNLSDIRRCVLLNFDPETETIEFRHYNVKVIPVGMSKGVKKLVKAKVPNLSRFDDVSDFLLRSGDLSESEAELDGEHNEVVLPQKVAGRGNIKSAKSAIRLTEIGPRMKLQLLKIEEGVAEGEVLYHHYIEKSEEELAAIKERRAEKKRLKAMRKKKQEDNVQKKLKEKEALKEKCLAGMSEKGRIQNTDDSSKDGFESTDDDAEYFRQEVGEEPEKELFSGKKFRRKRSPSKLSSELPLKRRKQINTVQSKRLYADSKDYKNKERKKLKPQIGSQQKKWKKPQQSTRNKPRGKGRR